MKTFAGMTPQRLAALVDRFAGLRVAVLGDFFLDKYLDVDPALAETSLETGKIAHQVAAIRTSPGAAGTVVCNLAALAAGGLWAVGLTGEDGEGYELRKGLAALGCRLEHLHTAPDRMTPTYLKPRDLTRPGLEGEHPRYDTKNRRRTPEPLQERIVASLDSLLPQVDAVIALDQVEEDDCGVVTAAVREALARRAADHPSVVFWADSRRRIRQFRRVIIKPNQHEALALENPPPGSEVDLVELSRALRALADRTGAAVFATRGEKGMAVCHQGEVTAVPGVHVEGPIDPTGAGDSATAGCVLGLAAAASPHEAALLGNLVASITVAQLATTGTARPDQLAPQLALWHQQQATRPA